LPYAANIPVLFSFVAMYAALGPLLHSQFGLGHGSVIYVRLAGLPALLLAPLAGWLVGRYGPVRVAVAGYLVAVLGLAAQAISVAALWALVLSSVIFVLGIATIVPALIALIGSRGGSSRAGALAIAGLALFTGASLGPLVAQLPIGFSTLMLVLAVLLLIAGALVAASSRPRADVAV
jgi:MFS family permease